MPADRTPADPLPPDVRARARRARRWLAVVVFFLLALNFALFIKFFLGAGE